MGQINVYFPEDLENEIRARAAKENKSLSAVIIDITQKELKPYQYPASFWKALETPAPDDFKREPLPASALSERESLD